MHDLPSSSEARQARRGRAARRWLLPALGCLALAFATYARNLGDDFLGDDFDLIGSFHGKPWSYFVRLLWSNESASVWSAWGIDPAHGEGYLRPLKMWLLALDLRLWGPAGAGFHVTSTLLFAGVLLLVHRLVRELLPARPGLAALGVLAVAVHPVFAEIVPFITAREELLALAGVLGSFLCLLRARRLGASSADVLGFLAFFTLGLLSKESAIIALPLALGRDVAHGQLGVRDAAQRRTTLRLYLPALAILATYLALRVVAFGNVAGGESAPTRYGSAAAFLDFHGHFLSGLVAPDMLTPFGVPHIGLLALLAGAAACAAWAWRRPGRQAWRTLLAVGPIWYLICSALLYGTYATHRHEGPIVVGLVLAALLLAAPLTQSLGERARWLAGLLAAACLLAAFAPPTLRMSRRFHEASVEVQTVRARIEVATADLPDGSAIRLEGVPQRAEPPYYFGWGLLSALRRPFSASDLAGRCTVIDERNLQLTRAVTPLPGQYDLVLRFDAPRGR